MNATATPPVGLFNRATQSITTPDPMMVLVIAIAALYLSVGLGSYGFLDNNEGLYAQIAQTMSHGEGLIIPQLNGVPYIEKPPLFYYLVALAFRLLGESEWSARLASSLAAMGCVGMVIWFGRRAAGAAAGNLSALVLTSAAGFIVLARTVMPDMLLTALLNAALFCAYVAIVDRSKRLLRTSLVLLALAILTKGLVALALYGLAVGAFIVWRRSDDLKPTLGFLGDPIAWALFFLVVAPWHILASIANRDFPWFYFINEHLLRFLGRRQPHDYYSGSALYHLPRLLLLLFPWPAYLLLKLYRPPPASAATGDARAFLWIACLGPALFFSFSLAKANYYMIVAIPPLALLIGMRIQAVIEQGQYRLLALPPAVLFCGSAIIGAGYWLRTHEHIAAAAEVHGAAGLAALAAFVLIGIGAFACALLRRPLAALIMVALMSVPLMSFLLYAVNVNEPYLSSRFLARQMMHDYPDADVFVFQDFERISSLPYYLRRPIRIVDSRSNDLWFGQQSGMKPDAFLSANEFIASDAHESPLLVVDRSRRDAFRRSALSAQMQAVAHTGRVTIYRRKPWHDTGP